MNLSQSRQVLRVVFWISDVVIALTTLFMAWSTWSGNSAVIDNFAALINLPDIYTRLYAVLQLGVGLLNLTLLALRHERSTRAAMLFSLFIPMHIVKTLLFNLSSGSWIALILYTSGYIHFCLLSFVREPFDRVLK